MKEGTINNFTRAIYINRHYLRKTRIHAGPTYKTKAFPIRPGGSALEGAPLSWVYCHPYRRLLARNKVGSLCSRQPTVSAQIPAFNPVYNNKTEFPLQVFEMEKGACFSENKAAARGRAVVVITIFPPNLNPILNSIIRHETPHCSTELVFSKCTEQCPVLAVSLQLVFQWVGTP